MRTNTNKDTNNNTYNKYPSDIEQAQDATKPEKVKLPLLEPVIDTPVPRPPLKTPLQIFLGGRLTGVGIPLEIIPALEKCDGVDANSFLLNVQDALLAYGEIIKKEFVVPDRYDGRGGRIDLVFRYHGENFGIELDAKTPRDKSLFKLTNNFEKWFILCRKNLEYGRKEINDMLVALKTKVGISAFVDSGIERNMAKHCVSLLGKIGKDEFVRRLEFLLNDPFHRKNSNKIKYIYNNIKGFIEPPPQFVIIK